MGKWILLAIGVIILFWVWATYNGLVKTEIAVEKAWGDVEAAYQRRLDTIPKFAQNAKFSSEFQLRLQDIYVQGREGVKTAAGSRDPAVLNKAANDGYNALVIAVRAEAVPQAKLDQLTELNAQIENVERVINHERKAFNDKVQSYMQKKRLPPGNIIAALFGFKDYSMFKAESGAEKSPTYDLNSR